MRGKSKNCFKNKMFGNNYFIPGLTRGVFNKCFEQIQRLNELS